MKKNNFIIKLGDLIVNLRYVLLTIFLILTTFCFFNFNNVSVNDSIASYLPNDTETKYGLDLMENEFGKITSIKLMVNDISEEEALNIQTELSSIQNIDVVMYDASSNYEDKSALYQIQLKDKNDKQFEQAIKDIKKQLQKEDYNLYSENLEDITEGITLVLVLVIIVVVVVMLLTSKSYFDPVIAFIVFAIAIILNMGSNFIFGEISYITKSIAVVLQLALSMDYVIIFMNHFNKEIDDLKDNKTLAIKKATSKSIKEILSSSLTTIAGLLALVFMQLKIGADIGVVLAKGIVCSLLTVILLMPCLLYIFEKIIVKLRHKPISFKTAKLSDFIVNKRKILLPIFIILFLLGLYLNPKYNYVYNTDSAFSFKKSENTQNLEKIENKFGKVNSSVVLVENKEKDYNQELILPKELLDIKEVTSVTSAGSIEIANNIYLGTQVNYLELSQILDIDSNLIINLYKLYASSNNEIEKLNSINEYRVSIIDLLYFLNKNQNKLGLNEDIKTKINNYSSMLNESLDLLESENYSRFIITVDSDTESSATYEILEDIRAVAEDKYDKVTLVGNSINALELEESFTSDNIIITTLTIIFIAIILFGTFKSIWMTIILILTIEGSILISFGIVSLLNMPIFFMGYVVVSAIQMGATIDYAIVLSTRYQQLREKKNKKEAIVGSLKDTIIVILTSATILIVAGFLIAFLSTSSVISSIGLFLGIGTLVSLLATIFVLPAILYALDKLINKK